MSNLPPVVSCSTCGAKIVWVRTEKGHPTPCNAGVRTVITAEGKTVRGWESHFSSCRDAELHRKKQEAGT